MSIRPIHCSGCGRTDHEVEWPGCFICDECTCGECTDEKISTPGDLAEKIAENRKKIYLEEKKKIRGILFEMLDPNIPIPDLINIVLEYVLKKELEVEVSWSAVDDIFGNYGVFNVCKKCVGEMTDEDVDEKKIKITDGMLLDFACKQLSRSKTALQLELQIKLIEQRGRKKTKRAWHHLNEDDPEAEEKAYEERKRHKIDHPDAQDDDYYVYEED
jgi:hypothetical protein